MAMAHSNEQSEKVDGWNLDYRKNNNSVYVISTEEELVIQFSKWKK